MKNRLFGIALLTAVLPWVIGGCATRVEPKPETAAFAGNSTPVAAAAAPTASNSPQMAAAVPSAAAAPHPAKAVRSELPPPSALETRTGIQITQVTIAAAGGLVDTRFKVLDAAKARKLLGNPANTPVLMAGDNPPLTAPHNALHGAKFSDGLVFYILYPNVRNAVKPGVEVTVAMGDVRLGPVTAQ
jgi:hypothetical protein